jgi:hypothetical protein
MQRHNAQSVFDDRDTGNPLFIHSLVDEYGLTPVQFRVLCHIARRGECFASADSISKVCRIHKNSLWPTLAFLCSQGLIEKTQRQGTTSIYTVAPVASWKPLHHPPQSNSQVGHSKVIARCHNKESGTHPQQNNSRKVIPLEGNPLKGVPPSGESPCSAGATVRPDLFPREYDALITDARKALADYTNNPTNWLEGALKPEIRAACVAIHRKMHELKCAKLGVPLPEPNWIPKPPAQALPKGPKPQQRYGIANVSTEDWKKGIEQMRKAIELTA